MDGALSSKSESSRPLSGRAIGALRASEMRADIRHNGCCTSVMRTNKIIYRINEMEQRFKVQV